MDRHRLKKVLHLKEKAKDELFGEFEFAFNNPVLIVFQPTDKKMKKKFYELLEGIFVLPVFVVIISEDSPPDSDSLPVGRMTWLNPNVDKELVDKYILASDMGLVFSEHMDLIRKLIENGVVVIGHDKSPFLQDYDPNHETGNAFTFESYNLWEIFRGIVRAIEVFRFPYDWKHILSN